MYQVEYAIEAIGHAGICIGILATDGVLLGVEKKIASKLLEVTTSEKMYKVRALAAPCRPILCLPHVAASFAFSQSFSHASAAPPLRSATTLAVQWRASLLMLTFLSTRRALMRNATSSSKSRRDALAVPSLSMRCESNVPATSNQQVELVDLLTLQSRYHEPVPVERLVRTICDKKQQYTQCAPFLAARLFLQRAFSCSAPFLAARLFLQRAFSCVRLLFLSL